MTEIPPDEEFDCFVGAAETWQPVCNDTTSGPQYVTCPIIGQIMLRDIQKG